jgi:hypothetical protein
MTSSEERDEAVVRPPVSVVGAGVDDWMDCWRRRLEACVEVALDRWRESMNEIDGIG